MDNPLEEALKNSGYTLEDSQSMETEEAQPEKLLLKNLSKRYLKV